jgi:hypothetical protein
MILLPIAKYSIRCQGNRNIIVIADPNFDPLINTRFINHWSELCVRITLKKKLKTVRNIVSQTPCQ